MVNGTNRAIGPFVSIKKENLKTAFREAEEKFAG